MENLTVTLSLWKNCQTNPPIYYFFDQPLEEIELLGLTISNDLCWANHMAKFTSQVKGKLGILQRSKSFLGKSELLTIYKTFVHSSMELCSPLWAGAPELYLSILDSVECKIHKIIERDCQRPFLQHQEKQGITSYDSF